MTTALTYEAPDKPIFQEPFVMDTDKKQMYRLVRVDNMGNVVRPATLAGETKRIMIVFFYE